MPAWFIVRSTCRRLGLASMLAAALAMPRPAVAQGGLPVGSNVFSFTHSLGETADPLRVFYHRPEAWSPEKRIVMVMHGLNRDADRYRDEWRPLADEYNFFVAVPEFGQAKFPGRAQYNFGNVVDHDNVPQPREAWTFRIVDDAFVELRARTGAARESYSLFGHSAGAQFAHRYLLFVGASKADIVVTANAGSYTMPTDEAAFPWGLKGTALDHEALTAAFARRVVVLLGDRDIDPNHPSLPRDPGAQAQGSHRLARGRLFYATAEAAAKRLGVPFNWSLSLVPGVAHSNAGMAVAAAKLIQAAGR